MKGLEALEELKFQVGNITYHTRDLQITTFKVRDSGLFETIEKELKALEIIKKYVYVSKPFKKACYICLNDESEMILEQEYDLLKEVLL